MADEKRKNPQPFAPTKGGVYENVAGGRYLCERCESPEWAWMTNIVSGWSFTAKGIVRYDDGKIEWDYSTDGTFVKIDENRRAQIDRMILGHKQRSILNAMLCLI